jgi:hypothetical protein
MRVGVADLSAIMVVAPGDVVEEILASQPVVKDARGAVLSGYLFAVVRLRHGGFAAVWEMHGRRFPTLDDLRASGVLNAHELRLLAAGANLE